MGKNRMQNAWRGDKRVVPALLPKAMVMPGTVLPPCLTHVWVRDPAVAGVCVHVNGPCYTKGHVDASDLGPGAMLMSKG